MIGQTRGLLALAVAMLVLAMVGCEQQGSHLNKEQFEARQKQKEGREGR